MSLTRLHIDNLKCFKEFSLPLAPLTLLTGFNAAGKTTSIQSLLLLAQAARSNSRHWKMALNDEFVQLGTPGDALHEGAESGIAVGVETDELSLSWHLRPESRGQSHAMLIESIDWKFEGKAGNFLCDNTALYCLLPIEADINLHAITNIIANTIYISAIRTGADDVYPIPTVAEPVCADVGVRGEFSAWWLEQMSDDEISVERRHPDEAAVTLRRQLNAWAGTLFPGAQVNASRINNTQLIQLSWRNHETDSWRRPSNIGYGLTYVFPILVAGLLAKKGQILVIDSPEAHLHPMGQSRMGQFLAMIAAAGVQVIVETHSDHVLNGVRRAVLAGKILPGDTAIHFFNARPRHPEDSAHVVSPIMDRNGNLSEWPNGFFDQAEADMAVLAGWVS